MLLIFKEIDKFGNWCFKASEKEQPISYYDLVEKKNKIDKLGSGYNPIYHSQKYNFCCINFRKQYDLKFKSFDLPIVNGLYKIKFNLTKTEHNQKTFVNAIILALELIELPKPDVILDF